MSTKTPAIDFERLDHLQLCIPIGLEKEARAFYCGLLGLKEIEKPEFLNKNGGFWLKLGNIGLHIGAEDLENKSKRHPAFQINNFDEFQKFLREQNIRHGVDKEIRGVRRISFFDPFNNRIEVLDKGIPFE